MFRFLIQKIASVTRYFFPRATGKTVEAPSVTSVQKTPEEWVDEVEIPKSLTDSISWELFKEPVVTPYGHVYSRAVILQNLMGRNKVCPLSNQPLREDLLSDAPPAITAVLSNFHTMRAQVIAAITATPAEKDVHIAAYRTGLAGLDQAMEQARGHLITQANNIQRIKNQLQINRNDQKHTDFWKTKGKSGQNIPDHVQQMMDVAAQPYMKVSDFTKAIDDARQLSWSSRFFKACSRAPETKLLYETKDLSKLTIR
ncbi:MAG TPA: U-box domain-containing protein [Gammaproteobacteria bacterium]|nr:U-box domain-containing protein [Gammaproteobacteria bacterium]